MTLKLYFVDSHICYLYVLCIMYNNQNDVMQKEFRESSFLKCYINFKWDQL